MTYSIVARDPLTGRYGSPEMSYIFSPQFKFSTWRKLWVALAEGERALGLPISAKQIMQKTRHLPIQYPVIRAATDRQRQAGIASRELPQSPPPAARAGAQSVSRARPLKKGPSSASRSPAHARQGSRRRTSGTSDLVRPQRAT